MNCHFPVCDCYCYFAKSPAATIAAIGWPFNKENCTTAILIMATVNHFMLSQLSKLARLEAEMSRNIDFYALLAPEMAGMTFVAFDQQP